MKRLISIGTLFVFLQATAACSTSNESTNCTKDSDCGAGEICDPADNTCKPCVPNCDGICCGDDGCGGTCPFNCQTGYFCDQITCKCDSCGCTTDTDCFPGRCCKDCVCIEKDCTSLECGPDPVCNISCGDCLDCNGESDPAMCNADGTCQQVCCPDCEGKCCGDDGCGGICQDNCSEDGRKCNQYKCECMVPGRLGDPCPYGDVNKTSAPCGGDMICVGIPADGVVGICPGGSKDECTQLAPSRNPDCVDGNCGGSFCAIGCDANGNCTDGYVPMVFNGICFCTLADGYSDIGEPCPFEGIHENAFFCRAGLTCYGIRPDGQAGTCPGGDPLECSQIRYTWNPECAANGNCGASFCSDECDAQGNCQDYRFEPMDIGGTCFCVPEDVGNAQAGDPCPFYDVNATSDNCAAGLACLGVAADGNSGNCPSGDPAECTDFPASLNPDCVAGNCGFSFCSEECDSQGDCTSGYQPQIVGGTCYCVPAN